MVVSLGAAGLGSSVLRSIEGVLGLDRVMSCALLMGCSAGATRRLVLAGFAIGAALLAGGGVPIDSKRLSSADKAWPMRPMAVFLAVAEACHNCLKA